MGCHGGVPVTFNIASNNQLFGGSGPALRLSQATPGDFRVLVGTGHRLPLNIQRLKTVLPNHPRGVERPLHVRTLVCGTHGMGEKGLKPTSPGLEDISSATLGPTS